MIQRTSIALLGFALGLSALAGAASAAADTDPPSRAGRLAYLEGPVSIQPAGAADWGEALLNRPLTTGDRLWTGEGARAEVQTGGAAIRLGEQTFLEVLNLDDQTVQLRLTEGRVHVRLRRLEEEEVFEVDTPILAVSPQRPGEFRIEAAPGGASTTVVVRGGAALVTGGGQAFTVRPGQQVRASGTAALAFDVALAPEPDALEGWGRERDRQVSRSASARYVSPGVVGTEDLDLYGSWQPDPIYGAVWVPRAVPAGWAPYRFGHWIWVEPWGWTWVDDAPWGFAPFHYGRWAYVRTVWVWIPGPIVVRPVYAPALVVWLGGSDFSVSIGLGGPAVGWFPLAPYEIYVPAYAASRTYIRQVNVTNTVITTVNITKIYDRDTTIIKNVRYVNRTVPGALSVAPHEALGRPGAGRPLAGRDGRAGDFRSAPPVPPSAESLFGRARQRVAAPPPAAVVERPVVARLAPPPPPVPFERQRAQLERAPGRPLDPAAVRGLRGAERPREDRVVRPLPERGAPSRPGGGAIGRVTPPVEVRPPAGGRTPAPRARPETARPSAPPVESGRPRIAPAVPRERRPSEPAPPPRASRPAERRAPETAGEVQATPPGERPAPLPRPVQPEGPAGRGRERVRDGRPSPE